jgi:hypothetical protein
MTRTVDVDHSVGGLGMLLAGCAGLGAAYLGAIWMGAIELSAVMSQLAGSLTVAIR